MKKQGSENQSKPIKTQEWEYDDHSGHSVQRKGKTVVKAKTLSQAKYMKLSETNHKTKKIPIKSGIYQGRIRSDLLGGRLKYLDDLSAGLNAVIQLIQDYELVGNRKTIIQLFSFILLGYTQALFEEYAFSPMMHCTRAPVVLVQPHKKDFTGGFEHLANIIRCFAVDTSLDGKLRHHNPAVLPDEFFSKSTQECAYMRLKGDKKKSKYTSQYRDTVVLLHSDFFQNSDIKNFVRRNPWATILLFNKKSFDKQVAVMKLNLNMLNISKRNWESMDRIKEMIQIRELMHYFVYWLSEVYLRNNISVRTKYWLRFGVNAVQRYHYACIQTGQDIVQGSEKQYLWLQAAALRLFLDFCFEEEIIDERTQEELWNAWCNTLIPGSRDEEIYRLDEEKQKLEEEKERNNVFELYKQLLKSFIESADDEMFVSRKQLAGKLDKEIHYRDRASIIVGKYGRYTKDKFKCVIILREDLKQFSDEKNVAFLPVISKMWGSDYSAEEYPSYIHTNNNVTLRKGFTINAVVLYAEELTFLQPDIYEKIMKIDV